MPSRVPDLRLAELEAALDAGPAVWIVSACPAHLFGRGQAITALAIAELLAVGYAGNDPLMIALRAELR